MLLTYGMTEQEKMTPADALRLLDSAVSRLTGTRQDHSLLLEAIRVLQAVVATPPQQG